MKTRRIACLCLFTALAASACSGGGDEEDNTPQWSSTTVDAEVSVRSIAIAVDPDDQPHLAFLDRLSQQVFYASLADGAWTSAAVPGTADADEGLALAIDAQGHPHLVFQVDKGTEPGGTRYAWNDGSSWTVETVESAEVGARTASVSIALTSAGLPVVSYWPGDGQGLAVATRSAAGAWSTAIADPTPNAGFHGTSIAVDGSDRPLVSYYVYDSRELRLASFDGASWNVETVAAPADAYEEVGSWSSLALDRDGEPQTAYLRFDGSASWSVELAAHGASGWTLETVGEGSVSPRLAFAPDGSPWIAWGVAPQSWVKVARRVDGAWTTEDIPGQSADWTLDLAVDSAGAPQVAFDHNGAVYATRR